MCKLKREPSGAYSVMKSKPPSRATISRSDEQCSDIRIRSGWRLFQSNPNERCCRPPSGVKTVSGRSFIENCQARASFTKGRCSDSATSLSDGGHVLFGISVTGFSSLGDSSGARDDSSPPSNSNCRRSPFRSSWRNSHIRNSVFPSASSVPPVTSRCAASVDHKSPHTPAEITKRPLEPTVHRC